MEEYWKFKMLLIWVASSYIKQNSDLMILYLTNSSVQRTIFFCPAKVIVKFME